MGTLGLVAKDQEFELRSCCYSGFEHRYGIYELVTYEIRVGDSWL